MFKTSERVQNDPSPWHLFKLTLCEEEEFDIEDDVRKSADTQYLAIKYRWDTLLSTAANIRTKHSETNAVILPNLELLKFSGELSYWQTYIDAFDNSVHKRRDIIDVHKRHHTLSHVPAMQKSIDCPSHDEPPPQTTDSNFNRVTSCNSTVKHSTHTTLLATTLLVIKDKNDTDHVLRAVIDSDDEPPRELYHNFVTDYLTSGDMTELSHIPLITDCYLIPHHTVVTLENGKLKVRVVFDASAKTGNQLLLPNNRLRVLQLNTVTYQKRNPS
ncbi:hypothetical protein WA026_020241 [Henosepilachna vigintioctopunctata]|uniref:Uncharacterized protein n=1 Tax=Henosepilachna vigintioctopunctata TaxID=420089 RepID=A0AAW1TX08_9CUCU